MFRRGTRGFSLVEVLIALALVILALLISMSLLWQQPRVLERLEARRAALRALEATMETMRAGGIPLTEGEIEWQVPTPELPPDFILRLAVAETADEGLLDVRLTATWVVQRHRFDQTLHSLVWAP